MNTKPTHWNLASPAGDASLKLREISPVHVLSGATTALPEGDGY